MSSIRDCLPNKSAKVCPARERDIINACINYLTLRGYEVLRNNTGLIVLRNPDGKKRAIRIGFKGSPDIIACSPEGRFVAIECKTVKNKLTPFQEAFLERLRKKNAIVIVARSVEDLINSGL